MGICLSSENYYDHYFPKLSSVLQFSERLQMYDYALHLRQKPVNISVVFFKTKVNF